MRSSSKLELAVDKNVFYTAAEIDNPPKEASIAAMRTLLKIIDECHRIVVSEEYLRSITNKLKTSKKVSTQYLLKILNELRAYHGKLRYVDTYHNLKGIPRKDIDVASFALQSRDKILIVADVNEKPADEKLTSILKTKYNVHVFTCKSFLALV